MATIIPVIADPFAIRVSGIGFLWILHCKEVTYYGSMVRCKIPLFVILPFFSHSFHFLRYNLECYYECYNSPWNSDKEEYFSKLIIKTSRHVYIDVIYGQWFTGLKSQLIALYQRALLCHLNRCWTVWNKQAHDETNTLYYLYFLKDKK